MTGLNIHSYVRDIASLVFLGDGVRRSGDWFVGCKEDRMARGIDFVTIISFLLGSTNEQDMGSKLVCNNQPSPQPSRIGEGVNIGGQSGVSPEIDCHPELVSGSHKMQQHTGQSDVQKMLKHRCQLSVYKMLKRVQHDINFLKRTYSLINLFSYLPRKRCAFTLAEGATHVAHFDDVRRAAFTLAEVLITLGVIGIVAAMTMPSLIANYQKKQTVTQLKKAYSTLSQALVAAQQEYGDMSGWEYIGMNLEVDETNDELNNFVKKYLEPYIKIIEYCYDDSSNKSCFYKSYSRGAVVFSNGSRTSNTASFIMNDGVVVRLEFNNDGNGKFGGELFVKVDLNGKKQPNMLGKDWFDMVIEPNTSKIKMFGSGQTRANLLNSYRGCNTNSSIYAGEYCGALIQYDGWEISDDYPW